MNNPWDRPDDVAGPFGQPADANAHSEPEWKQVLRARFEEWLADLDAPPDDPGTEAEAEIPDLQSFHADLTTMASEFRASNRRTAEAMKQWSELMNGFQTELARVSSRLDEAPTEKPPSATHWTDLIELADRLGRIRTAFEEPPASGWFGRDRIWRDAWRRQRDAFEILAGHMRDLLRRAGISRVETVGQTLDVTCMTVVQASPTDTQPPETVLLELRPGYRQGERILRLAEVSVAVPPGDESSPHSTT